jgi:hypothetical protein
MCRFSYENTHIELFGNKEKEMSPKKDEKDVMSEVINDISSAAEEAAEEADELMEEAENSVEDTLNEAADDTWVDELPDTAEEAAEVFEEAGFTPKEAETIIVKFDNDLEAARAVRVLNKALRKRHDTIYQGAIVTRDEKKEELAVEDLRDMGLADLVTDTAAMGINLGKDGFKLLWKTAAAGVGLVVGGLNLLRRTVLQAAGLGGSTMTMRYRKQLDTFHDEQGMQTNLEPGESAVVIVADRETAVEIANDLIKSGGELA